MRVLSYEETAIVGGGDDSYGGFDFSDNNGSFSVSSSLALQENVKTGTVTGQDGLGNQLLVTGANTGNPSVTVYGPGGNVVFHKVY